MFLYLLVMVLLCVISVFIVDLLIIITSGVFLWLLIFALFDIRNISLCLL